MIEPERRWATTEIEIRGDGNGKGRIHGYAAVFNQLSDNLGGFRERIARKAFEGELSADVRAFFNHDPNLLLGRVSSGTLRLEVDERGLMYEVDVPDTAYGRDLVELIRRGDVTQSSFAFRTKKDSWKQDGDETIRTVEAAELVDVSPVVIPAYPQTTTAVAKRSLEHWKEGATHREELQRLLEGQKTLELLARKP